jgi:phage-related protein
VVARRPLIWLGSALKDLRAFPETARRRAGHELDLLQQGLEPTDWKPMATVGDGVYELRIRVDGAFRVFYVAKRTEGVVVLHAFQKKTARTTQLDLDLAAHRLRRYLAASRRRPPE